LSRFSVLPVLFASASELARIMEIHARRLGIGLAADLTEVLATYTAQDGVLSGRSAVQLLEAAHVQALRAGEQAVTPAHVQAALSGWVGNDWTPAAEYSTLSALVTARHADAWPWFAARQLGEDYEIPAYLKPYRTQAGGIDVTKMRERAAELGQSRVFG
jgi:hypothetical protein